MPISQGWCEGQKYPVLPAKGGQSLQGAETAEDQVGLVSWALQAAWNEGKDIPLKQQKSD